MSRPSDAPGQFWLALSDRLHAHNLLLLDLEPNQVGGQFYWSVRTQHMRTQKIRVDSFHVPEQVDRYSELDLVWVYTFLAKRIER